MEKILIKLLIAIIALNLVHSVLITHSNDDIRGSILKSFENKPKKEQFKVFHFLFNKKYDLNTEEGLFRYRIFKSNLKFIETENAKNNSYVLGITEFADLSAAEFRKTYLKETSAEEYINKEKFLTRFDLDDEEDDELFEISGKSETSRQQIRVDWRPYLNPPNSQGTCGSCWAFAIVNSIEANYNIKFGNSPKFSQQQLVDCDLENNACDGGSTTDGLSYVQQNGLAFENAYPYISGITDERGTCKASNFPSNKIVESFEACKTGRCSKTQFFSMLQKGALIISMDADGGTEANSIMQLYKGGVIENLPCVRTNHAVVLAGIDADEKGEFLIARNSWGGDWGENGNFRIRRRTSDDTCYMESKALLPIVKQTFNPVPPPEKPGCLRLFSQCALKGESREVCENLTKIENFPLIGGFLIGKFTKIYIYYEKENCQGSRYTFTDGIGCFANKYPSLFNNIKSILVEDIAPPAGCVWLYEGNCLSGAKVEVCSSVEDLSLGPYNFANRTSSFKLGAGIKSITIYTEKKFKGTSSVRDRDDTGMEGKTFNKRINSIRFNL